MKNMANHKNRRKYEPPGEAVSGVMYIQSVILVLLVVLSAVSLI